VIKKEQTRIANACAQSRGQAGNRNFLGAAGSGIVSGEKDAKLMSKTT
jgi:hypothetical protein